MARSIAGRSAARLSSGRPSCGPRKGRVTAEALALYGKHFGALVLTCAIALLRATLLAAGAVRFGLATLGRGDFSDAGSHGEQINEKQHELLQQPTGREQARTDRVRQLRREAVEGGAAFDG